jgi:hypothetical protein
MECFLAFRFWFWFSRPMGVWPRHFSMLFFLLSIWLSLGKRVTSFGLVSARTRPVSALPQEKTGERASRPRRRFGRTVCERRAGYCCRILYGFNPAERGERQKEHP